MEEPRPETKLDLKAVLFLLITLGLAALELWGLIRGVRSQFFGF